MQQNASTGHQSEAPRRRWKPGLEQHAGLENQDSQHMLNLVDISDTIVTTSITDRNKILSELFRVRKKQAKHKVFGRDIPGTSGTQTSGYPGEKLYASGLFLLF